MFWLNRKKYGTVSYLLSCNHDLIYLPVEEGLVWGPPMLVVLVFAAAADAGREVIEDGVADGGLEELLTGT